MTKNLKHTPAIKIKNNKQRTILTFNQIPIWQGVQKKPGSQKALPLTLIENKNDYIRQLANKKRRRSIQKNYKKKNYKFISPPPGSSKWGNSLALRNFKFLKNTLKNGNNKKFLEIGAGTDWLAKKITKHYKPLKYTIVEPVKIKTSKDIEFINDFFPSKKILKKEYDVVLCFSVLEHVPCPKSFLSAIRKILNPNGSLILTVPDCQAQFETGDLNVLEHEHLNYFTKQSFKKVLLQNNLKIHKIKRENDLLFLKTKQYLNFSYEKKHQIIAKRSSLLKKSFKAFKRLLENKIEIVKIAAQKNVPIYFYGATSGLNIFFSLTKFCSNSEIKIFDSDKSKKGFFIPFSSSPICQLKKPKNINQSLNIISALSFQKQILKKLKIKNKKSIIFLNGQKK